MRQTARAVDDEAWFSAQEAFDIGFATSMIDDKDKEIGSNGQGVGKPMGNRYGNLDGTLNGNTFKDVLQWQRERRKKTKDLSWRVPRAEADVPRLQANRSKYALTWIGHSTFLIQLAGCNILTDPVWARWMGVAMRLAEPGLALSQLPEIDVILISHSHYDHLHIGSLRAIKRRQQREPLLLVPAGLGRFLERKGFRRVKERSWWDSHEEGALRFTFVPAQHWTRRTLWDTNRSHWGGWMVEGDGRKVYFAGDTGYFAGFREIGSRFRDIDTVLMPIGAYEPEWFMHNQHVNPEQAVQAYLDLNSPRAIIVPMHYGSFRLADDTPREALDRLLGEWQRRGLPEERLRVPGHGETLWNPVCWGQEK